MSGLADLIFILLAVFIVVLFTFGITYRKTHYQLAISNKKGIYVKTEEIDDG